MTRFIGLLAIIIFNTTGFAFSGNGSGTSGDPYQIANCSQLQEMDLDGNSTTYYILVNDIDCDGASFTPILITSDWQAKLNGNNHTIFNLEISSDGGSNDSVGLFSRLGSNSRVEQLIISNANVTSTAGLATGILAGISQGAIEGVMTNGSVSGVDRVGGLVGYAFAGSITRSTSSATVNLSEDGIYAGGLIGFIWGFFGTFTLQDVYANGVVCPTTNNRDFCGGLVGGTWETAIVNSYSASTVSGDNSVGGLIGLLFDTTSVTNSFSIGSVVGGSPNGGLVGNNSGSNSYSGAYFDISRSGRSSCTNSGNPTGCTGVNDNDAEPNYFFNNNTNAPMSAWDFTTVWATSPSNPPQLRAIPTFTPTPTPTSTNTPTPTVTPTSTPTVLPDNPIGTPTPIGTADPDSAKPKVSVNGNQIILTVKEYNPKRRRYYYGYIVNVADNSVFARKKIKVRKGSGRAVFNNVPAGSYWVFKVTKVVTTNGPRRFTSKLRLVSLGV